MSEVDRQRIAAVRTLEALGHRFRNGRRQPPVQAQCCPEVDALHSLLVGRADILIGCTDGSVDQDELQAIGEAIELYEAVQWPNGNVGGGKG